MYIHIYIRITYIKIQDGQPKIGWSSVTSRYESTCLDEQRACSEKPNDLTKTVLLTEV